MNKIAAISSGSISEGLVAPFPSLKLAGGGVAKGSPPAFLIQSVGAHELRIPLQVIPIVHSP